MGERAFVTKRQRSRMARPRIYGIGSKEKQRAYRARLAASAAHRLDAPSLPVVSVIDHGDPVSGRSPKWSKESLTVPPGHPRSRKTYGAARFRG